MWLFQGFGGSFISPSPSPSPVTPAQTSLLQPNFDAAFGTTAPTTGSSFDASGESKGFFLWIFLCVLCVRWVSGTVFRLWVQAIEVISLSSQLEELSVIFREMYAQELFVTIFYSTMSVETELMQASSLHVLYSMNQELLSENTLF